MRVLLYETGKSGHRAVYRSYYETACRSAGVDAQVYSGPPFNGLFGFSQHLQAVAKTFDCDLVHLLTMDDHTKRLFFSVLGVSGAANSPILGTYYLFGNFSNRVKRLALDSIWYRKNLAAIAVPRGAELAFPHIAAKRGVPVYLISDPFPTNGPVELDRTTILKSLSLPDSWNSKTIVLVFGVLNKRRGVDLLAKAARACVEVDDNVAFIFAGRLDRSTLDGESVQLLESLSTTGLAVVIDSWLSDESVEMLYQAADVFCIHPERGFAGVNSTAMRALDCGLTVAAPGDSITACCASACDQGASFERNSVESLKRVLLNCDRNALAQAQTWGGKPRCRLTASIEKVGNELASLYREIATSNRRV